MDLIDSIYNPDIEIKTIWILDHKDIAGYEKINQETKVTRDTRDTRND